MKVFFRISKLGFGGAERVFISIAKELKQRPNLELAFVVDKLVSGETESKVASLDVKIHELNSGRTLFSIIPFSKLITSEKPDVIISAYTDTNFAAILSNLISRRRAKLIVSEHASLVEHWQSFSAIRKFFLSMYVRFGYRLSDYILAVSKGISDQLLTFGHKREKIGYIHNPVRFDNSEQDLKFKNNEVLTILAVGRITPQKDYKTLIAAFSNVVQSVRCKLVIVGGVHDQNENFELISLIKSLGLSDKVELVGFTENVDNFYRNADVFVLSSAWEGFGNVLVEAMSFGLPVVSTDCNYGPSEILENGEYGFLVPIRDHEALANAIVHTLRGLSFINRKKLTMRASQFSESKIANNYLKLFETIVNQK